MKKIALVVIAASFTVAIISASKAEGVNSSADTTKKAVAVKAIYTCPMHPDVLSNKPGKCPKASCGMTLVKKAEKNKNAPKMKM